MRYILFVLAIVSSACNEDKYSPDFSNGKATAISDGKNWEGEVRGLSNAHDSSFYDVSFTLKNALGESKEEFIISYLPRSTGRFKLNYSKDANGDTIPNAVLVLLSADGDAVYGVYSPLKDHDNCFINVTEFNSDTSWVKGTFKAIFIEDLRYGKMFPDNPDTIKFENGVFDVRLEE